MLTRLINLFHKSRPKVPDFTPADIDTARLDESLELLRTTTVEVSEAAVSAARVLEERLRDSEHRFYSTVDSIDDLVIIKDELGRWTTMNKVGHDLYSWYHGEYYLKTDKELGQLFPVFKSSLDICTDTDEQAWEQRRSFRSEEFVAQGATVRHFDMIKTPVFNEDGSRKELIVVGRDVTELYEKSKRTKACFTALNSASDMIVILDKHGRVFFCNDKFIQAFELVDHNQVVGHKLQEIIDLSSCFREMWTTVSQNKVWEGITHDLLLTGDYKITVVPMMNGAADPIFYICTMKASSGGQAQLNNIHILGESIGYDK